MREEARCGRVRVLISAAERSRTWHSGVDDHLAHWQEVEDVKRRFYTNPLRLFKNITKRSFSLETTKKNQVFGAYLLKLKLAKTVFGFLIKFATSP